MATDKARAKRGRKAKSTGRAKKTAAKKGTAASKTAAKAAGERLYTLTQIGRMASVSMPTLQKYKRLYQDRIPSVGEGRKQRYPKAAVAVLRQLKKENLAKRGRPRKVGSKASTRRKGARPRGRQKDDSGLLTLTEISRRTKISYPTVSRYVKVFLDRIPHVGSGRKRRFPPEAVEVFRQLRAESRPGRPARAATAEGSAAGNRSLAARIQRLEKAQTDLAKEVASLGRLLRKPLKLTVKR